jgi:hypothetical protein
MNWMMCTNSRICTYTYTFTYTFTFTLTPTYLQLPLDTGAIGQFLQGNQAIHVGGGGQLERGALCRAHY